MTTPERLRKAAEKLSERIAHLGVVREDLAKRRDAYLATAREMEHARKDRAALPNREKRDPLVLAASKWRGGRGYALHGLCSAVQAKLGPASGCGIAILRAARRGRRPIRREVAEAIAELTGFKATAKNWPGGIK